MGFRRRGGTLETEHWRIEIAVLIPVLASFAIGFFAAGFVVGLEIVGGYIAFVVVTNFPSEVRSASSYIAIGVWVVLVSALQGCDAGHDFYVVSAQVLPVLILASAITSRFSLLGTEEPERRVRVLLLYAVGLGEVYSLLALAKGSPPGSSLSLVAAALAVAAILLFAELLALEESEQPSPEGNHGTENSNGSSNPDQR